MKSYIKSSFLAVLFLAVFCMGFSSTNAKQSDQIKSHVYSKINSNLLVNRLYAALSKADCYVTVFNNGRSVTYKVPCKDIPPPSDG